MDSLTCAKATAEPIQAIGQKFMFDPITFAVSEEMKLESPLHFYSLGRFGILGDPSGDDVVREAVFFHPETFKEMWEAMRPGVDLQVASQKFLDCSADWGRANLADLDGTDILADLGEKVLNSASYDYARIVSAIKNTSLPTDSAGKAGIVSYALRELRFCHHAKVIREEGMGALEAILAGPGGEANAQMFQWPEPYPEVDEELVVKRNKLEEMTDDLSAPDFEVLTDEEREKLATAAQQIASALEG